MQVTDGARAVARLGGSPWLPSADQIAGLGAAIAEAEKRARGRTLATATAEVAVGRYLRLVAEVAALDPAEREWIAGIVVEAHGGRVPNGYGYPADATWLRLTWSAPGDMGTGAQTGLAIGRDRAATGPYGRGWTCAARAYTRGTTAALGALVLDGSEPRRARSGAFQVLTWHW